MPRSRSSSTSSASEDARPVVRVRDLTAQINGHVLLRGANFDLYAGEILGVVGASGAGKSVLLQTVIGLMPPAAGTVEIFGEEIHRLGEMERRRINARWGVLFQDGALFSSLTVAENVAVPLREQLDLPSGLCDGICTLKIALVGLPPDTGWKYPAELSGGMRKRAGLARCLALDPKLLFLDEPTAGLDPIAAAEFDTLVHDLKESLGLTVFMVTHDLDSLAAICDRVAVLVDNQLKIGTMTELMRDPHPWIQAYFRGPRGRAARAAETSAANG